MYKRQRLVACGGFAGNVLKCFAVDESLRGENALGTLLSSLIKRQYERGITQLLSLIHIFTDTISSQENR